MSNFQIIESRYELPKIYPEWQDCPEAKCVGLRCNEKGKSVSESYSGLVYEVISKQKRKYSLSERYRRDLLGVLAVICTLALGLFFKQVRNLFRKDHQSIKFAIPMKSVTARDSDELLLRNHDLNLHVLGFLDVKDLGRCEAVSKKFRSLSSTESLWQALPLPPYVFGKKEWTKHVGDIGEEPYLLKRPILKLLNSNCPFQEGKKTRDTHLLMLIPSHIDGLPLSLNRWIEIVNAPKKHNSTTYDIRKPEDFRSFDHFFERKAPPSHFVLMQKCPSKWVKGTHISEYILRSNRRTKITYQPPTALDAAIIFWMNAFQYPGVLLPDFRYKFAACIEENGNRRLEIRNDPQDSDRSFIKIFSNRANFKVNFTRYLQAGFTP